MLYLSGYCFCLELNLLMGKALKSETRNEYDMTGDSVMNVEVFDAGSNSNNIPLVKHSAMGGQFVSFKELSLGSSKISQVFHGCVHEAGRCHRGEKLPAQIPSAREGRSEAKLNIGVETVKRLAAKGVSVLAMEAVPRNTKAQKLDTLPSTANLAGYKAVIEAFHYLPRFSKPLTTSAGQVQPAKVLILDCG